MDIVNPNYLNYMEQIQKNRKDIEKLYDEELSDITQLNFKENDENGLDYENGKATFYGKSTIIRDENTENLEVDSKVELKISSGDDDIVIDAGEDNSTLEIHLDNETRNKINRALLTPINTPNEREFVAVGTNNSQIMIPESEITNLINAREIKYDMNNIVSIDASTLTTLEEFFELFCVDKTKTYYAALGTASDEPTNFKALVGTPSGFGGYARGLIKLDCQGTLPEEKRTVFKIMVLDNQSSKIAFGYIWKSNANIVYFTGWDIVGD